MKKKKKKKKKTKKMKKKINGKTYDFEYPLFLLLLLPLAPLGHKPVTITFQVLLSFTSIFNSLQLLPILLLSLSKSPLRVFFGLLFLVSCGIQDKAYLVIVPCGFLYVCPIHLHFLFLVSSSILVYPFFYPQAFICNFAIPLNAY
jgi:hypothetical protein